MQLAHIVSSAVSQALTKRMHQIGSTPPLPTAVNHGSQTNAAVEQVQPPTKFDIPAFEDDSEASWLTWSQRVMYQVRACGFEAEVAAVVGEGLSVGADGFHGSNVHLVRLQNVHVACMSLMKAAEE